MECTHKTQSKTRTKKFQKGTRNKEDSEKKSVRRPIGWVLGGKYTRVPRWEPAEGRKSQEGCLYSGGSLRGFQVRGHPEKPKKRLCVTGRTPKKKKHKETLVELHVGEESNEGG